MNKIIIGLILGLMLISPALATEYTCSTCDECETAITNANDFDTVKLTTDITGQAVTCINDPAEFNNITFDCDGKLIGGVYSETNYGIYLNIKSNNTIKNCRMGGFKYALNLNSANDNTLFNNTITATTGSGFNLVLSLRNNIINNTATGMVNYGIYLDRSTNSTIINNTMVSSNNGITLYKGSNSTIRYNTMTSNTNNGLRLTQGGDYIAEYNTITSNKEGIYILQTPNNLVRYNTLTTNQYGVWIYGASSNTISNNTITGSTNTGIYSIYYFFPVEYNIIANNTITGSTSKGIYMITSDLNDIMYNTINNTGGYSIHVQEGNLNDFVNNTVYGGTAIYYSNVMLAGDKNNIYNMKANNTYFSAIENNVYIKEVYDSAVPAKADLVRYSYLNITNNVAGSYLTLNLTYGDEYITNKDESTIKMFKYNTTWYELPSTLYVDDNYASYYITSFSVFALTGDDIPIPEPWTTTWTKLILITFLGFIMIFAVLIGVGIF